MCMVSVIQDYGRTRVNPTSWSPQTFGEYQEILVRLAELDRKLGEPNCEDPAKAAWMREVEARLKKLEKKG